MYSLRTSVIILFMILTGATRSVGVKLFYQLGFGNPLFVTLLYLAGQSLAIVAYWVSHFYHWAEDDEELIMLAPAGAAVEYAPLKSHQDDDIFENEVPSDSDDDPLNELELQTMHTKMSVSKSTENKQQFTQIPQQENDIHNGDRKNPVIVPFTPEDSQEHIDKIIDQSVDHHHYYFTERRSLSMPLKLEEDQQLTEKGSNGEVLHRSASLPVEEGTSSLPRRGITRRGSKTGLTQESTDAVAWIHHIPWQLKPAIPGFFNLCNAALRWGSLVYVAASICDMLMSGSELVLSVVAARVIRKREISGTRWAGVAVVTVGLLAVRTADVLDSDAEMATMDPEEAAELKRAHFIGAILIIGQSLTAICQDMAEELFLQEADFPATLLLGMEGMFGLLFGIPFYLIYAPETPGETWATLQSSPLKKFFVLGLIGLFTVTGIFNIMATGVTSSMTRNMWKNFRTILVWVMGLIIYYGWGNIDLGEAWVIPDSFFTLFGFLIMLSGIYVYYKNK